MTQSTLTPEAGEEREFRVHESAVRAADAPLQIAQCLQCGRAQSADGWDIGDEYDTVDCYQCGKETAHQRITPHPSASIVAMSKLTPEAIADAVKYAENYCGVSSEQHLNATTTGRFLVVAIAALEAIGRVRELHQVFYFDVDDCAACACCGEDWPCETIAAIDGEEKP